MKNKSKQTNEDSADWSDLKAVFESLHSNSRTTSPAVWRNSLEKVFNVDIFLKWLAANTVMQNWDTYGKMAHNYFLYNNNGKLNWIPWDNNFALQDGMDNNTQSPPTNISGSAINPPPGTTTGSPFQPGTSDSAIRPPGSSTNSGIKPPENGMGNALSLSLSSSEVSDNWALIRFLMDDPIYNNKYKEYVKAFSEGAFEPAKIKNRYQELHDLIKDYVVGTNGEQSGCTYLSSSQDFETAISTLKTHADLRKKAVTEYLK